MIHFARIRKDCLLYEHTDYTYLPEKVTCTVCLARMKDAEFMRHVEKEEPMPAKTYYIVMIDTTPYPRPTHDSYKTAAACAEKLLSSSENKGKVAIIFKAVSCGTVKDNPVEWKTLD